MLKKTQHLVTEAQCQNALTHYKSSPLVMQLYPIPSRCGYKLRKHQHYSERKTKYHSCQLPPLRLFPLQSWKILPGFQSMNTVAAPVDSQAVLRVLLAMKVSVSRFLPCEVIVWTWIHHHRQIAAANDFTYLFE